MRIGRATGLLGLVLLGLALLGAITAPPAGAHSDLTGADPAQDSMVPSPGFVRLGFTSEVQVPDGGVTVSDSEGEVVATVTTVGKEVRVVPHRPIAPGPVTVAFRIRASDGHVIDGSYSFTSTGPDTAAVVTPPPATTSPGTTATVSSHAGHSGHAGAAAPADPAGGPARFAGFMGILACIGAATFLAVTFRGTEHEAHRIGYLLRRASVVVVVASVVEVVAVGRVFHGATPAPWNLSVWGAVLGDWYGLGLAVRLVGIALVMSSALPQLRRAHHRVLGTSAGGPVDLRSVPRLVPGAALLVASVAFIGHSAGADAGPVDWIADVTHTGAAGAWGGGLAAIAVTSLGRLRDGFADDVVRLARRFSTVAAPALAVLLVSGIALAMRGLDGPGSLVETDYGRLVSMKVLFVLPAVVVGIRNGRRLAVADAGADPVEPTTLVRSIGVELGCVAVAVALTAILVTTHPGG